ncbi:hypothetical protein NSTCB13_03779 [Nostoc sp. DSM 114160]
MTALILNLSPTIELTDEQFFQLCQNNRDLRLERTAEGELIIMPPTGWESGNRNSRLTQRLGNWADADGTGLTFDSSTGFKLPNGANRSPDASWGQPRAIRSPESRPRQISTTRSRFCDRITLCFRQLKDSATKNAGVH